MTHRNIPPRDAAKARRGGWDMRPPPGLTKREKERWCQEWLAAIDDEPDETKK